MDKETLDKVAEWANQRVESGHEPPWTYNKLKKLAELAIQLSKGMEVAIKMECSQQSYELQETDLQQQGNIIRLSSARCHLRPERCSQLPT